MKRIVISATCIGVAVIISGVSYLKGHRDGSLMADLRSLSYETPILESLKAEKNDEARRNLTGLIEFRHSWLTSGISTKQSWAYWSGVDKQEARANILPRAQQVIKQMERFEEGYIMKDVNMNHLMSWLAKKAGMQYFHNSSLDDPKYAVTGHMNPIVDPRSEIDVLAPAYDLRVRTKNDTLYVLTNDQYDGSSKRACENFTDQEDGADQPATTPELKAEGEVKPKPESEERSQ